ncbi:5-(carboxyamino)imidazole ribonucleotide synthase [Rhodoblastus acidophilus]|uniref:N5-carboxyaminoimidazole ribonucleotide synthase n=1 Tax=Rhodoblastus acidophilus TaxID=1074 RepID=A0A212RQ04_RHOAC|nr:5-(carboxyamino)imidazole ribonucleotide synthase [Rhodoblastus acidophilus]MCW2316153.1 5-(carboxyamino)imidazole ribonucleotide synthase [Rhodoblastus acidophilus]PPQ38502.1 5-(carboxyamino)imidazole ribonucleotide synthase [Rhodoblastus acidophilus]RAI21815.1 5-(carboxyamino)imidazole ribonucleotide synthase [Rhodoblastus acidophilus]SNB74529.1 5-(carboxyamino)imidazole ribonucleotide synthase [Rhodoblastus acidophilus]
MSDERALAPGARIGIVGGGQLGRMLALAAARLGLSCHVYTSGEGEPAIEVAAKATVAPYDDESALARFAAGVDVVTYEFENIPAATAEFLNKIKPVRPSPRVLALTQDRLVEKDFVSGLGIGVAAYARVDDPGALARAVARIGRPSILKTRRFGYDGKGQTLLKEGSDLAVSFRSLGGQLSILEGFVPFKAEVSVVAARGLDGEFLAWDVGENVHDNHILDTTTVPAHIPEDLARRAADMTKRIAEALDYVGVLAVEMFVVDGPDGLGLLVNEIAPRVHNSGHWTLDGAVTSQFEQHIRAVCGFPLGATRAHGPVVMRNLIGDDIDSWRDLLRQRGACLHIYGKSEARPGRKMGHVTFLKT